MRKAFDTIPFDLLLKKLEFYGVHDNSLDWFKSYLTGRQQCVEINGIKSNNLTVKMGVPQGSILGPLLFLLFINDLPNCLTKSTPVLFADDTTVIKSGTDIKDLYRDMNYELENLEQWCKVNKLSLNAKKTKYILFKPKKYHIHFEKLNFGGEEIERIGENCKVTAFKFLGHWVDDNLNWDFHTNKLLNKLNSTNYILAKLKNKFPLAV